MFESHISHALPLTVRGLATALHLAPGLPSPPPAGLTAKSGPHLLQFPDVAALKMTVRRPPVLAVMQGPSSTEVWKLQIIRVGGSGKQETGLQPFPSKPLRIIGRLTRRQSCKQ